MNSYDTFRLREIILLILIVIALVFFGWLAYSLTHQKELMEISDSGSTSFAAWELKVNKDGSGTLTCDPGANPCTNATFKSGTFPSAALKKDLPSTNFGSYKDTCDTSSSTSVDTLLYKKTQMKGVNCYIQTESTPLALDIKKVYAVLFP